MLPGISSGKRYRLGRKRDPTSYHFEIFPSCLCLLPVRLPHICVSQKYDLFSLIMPVPGLSLAISLFFLTLSSRPALAYPAYISYDTLFFAPTQVLGNAWFNQSKSAQGTAADWANQLMESGPWCA
jgi:hypothetical protein